MKQEVPLSRANRIINPGQTILVTSSYKDKSNIITLAWNTPLSHKPPIVGIAIAKSHLSSELIQKSKEFIINIPSLELLDSVVFCGIRSGRDIDKFKESKLTRARSNRLSRTPLISECIGYLECSLIDMRHIGDHILFIGEVVSASAESEFFDEKWLIDKVKLIHHLGGKSFTSPDKEITV